MIKFTSPSVSHVNNNVVLFSHDHHSNCKTIVFQNSAAYSKMLLLPQSWLMNAHSFKMIMETKLQQLLVSPRVPFALKSLSDLQWVPCQNTWLVAAANSSIIMWVSIWFSSELLNTYTIFSFSSHHSIKLPVLIIWL